MNSEATRKRSRDAILINDGLNIVSRGKAKGIVLRLLGAIAIEVHTEKFKELYHQLRRRETVEQFTDIDIVSYGAQRGDVHRLLVKELDYIIDRRFAAYFGENRLLYHQPAQLYDIDVFFDRLIFSHDLYLGSRLGIGRLESDYPTLSLADLILEKLQIHEMNEKDIKDLIALIMEHDVGASDQSELINLDRISKVLADDWGFWFDGKVNLNLTLRFAEKYCGEGLVTKDELGTVIGKVDMILGSIEAEPKTRKWQKRAKTGTARPWWRDVEELVR